jgi:hypothetical protein
MSESKQSEAMRIVGYLQATNQLLECVPRSKSELVRELVAECQRLINKAMLRQWEHAENESPEPR